VLLIVFILSCLALPLFIALMGFDQLSADVSQKSVRYFVVRVRRTSLLLGKFLAQTAALAGLTLASVAMMVGVSMAVEPTFGVGAAAGTFLRLWVAAVLFALPWLALTALCSAALKQSAVSLVSNIFLLLLLLLVWGVGQGYRVPGDVTALGAMRDASVLAYARFASPWGFGVDLLHPSLVRALGSALGTLGFCTLLLGLGGLALEEKDW
jgi:ABC-2 type transport system permease protein